MHGHLHAYGVLLFFSHIQQIHPRASCHYVMIFFYSLRPIILFVNMNVSRLILVVDTFILTKSNMGEREYFFSHQT
jgi:hypothetical protein